MKKFFKPVYRDNWGNISVSVGGTEITQDEWEGKKVTVRWYDGTEERVTIYFRKRTTPISDHGHNYLVKSFEPYFTVDHKGVSLGVDLIQVEVAL